MYRFLTSKPLWTALLVLALAGLVWRAVARRKRVRSGEESYRKYADLLREAFKGDKPARDRALEAIAYLESDNPAPAEGILNRLMVECREEADFAALRTLLALCYQRQGEDLKAERYYRRVLEDAAKKRPIRAVIAALNEKDGRMDIVERAAADIVFEEEEAE